MANQTDVRPFIKHPAKFSDPILAEIAPLLADYERVLDPFAGVGRIQEVCPRAVCLELEREWAEQIKGTGVQGNALCLPFADQSFDAVVTSPVYGNRMSDHHNAQDGSLRHSYKHYLGHDLHADNAGQLQWGKAYRQFHQRAWAEVRRVLKPRGRFILNISDHVRGGAVQDVTGWHMDTLASLGFTLYRMLPVATKRQLNGAHNQLRVENEWVLVYKH